MYRCMGCMEEYDEEYEVCPYCGYVHGSTADEVYQLQPESVLHGRYIIGRVIGYGGFGITYLAWDCVMNQKVAVKEYMPSEFATRMPGKTILTVFSGDREEQFNSGRDKFVDEAKRLAKFNQLQGVVHVYDTFEENNTAYIIMELLEGESLKVYLEKNKTLSVDEALAIIIAVLETLKELHKDNLLHRDIAPDNIFITADNQIKLLDFGAARFATTKHSKSLSVLLKPGYSPEEQYRSRGDQGPWTDVYAVAATFYKLVTGITPQDSIERSIKDNVKAPSKLGVKINKSLENAILNALNIKIEDRTPSAEVFLEELRAEEVKRKKVKMRKTDIGRWPIWVKISSSVACVAILSVVVLMATGVIRFNTAMFSHSIQLAEGQARVPSVTNHTLEEAEELCDESGLIMQIVGKEYSDTVPEDYILMQSVLGGQIVELDEVNTIGVIVSAGIEEKSMPDLYGYSQEKAEEELDALDLLYQVEDSSNIVAPGAVFLQDIEREQVIESGTNVYLGISTGVEYNDNVETTVPDIVGLDEYEAATVLNEAGLYFRKTDMTYDSSGATTNKYEVISQEVPAGTSAIKGDVIEVVVSLGSDIKVPDVSYKAQQEAYDTLTNLTFIVSIVYEDSDTVAGGHVIRQSIDAGSVVKANTEITIYISNGREDAQVIDVIDVNVTPEVQDSYDQSTTEAPIIVINEPTTEEALITVTNVVGMQYSAVESSLSSQGLSVSMVYQHDKNSQDGTILSQSLGSGSQVKKGTAIVLTVCNNEQKTQYATRTVSEETTQSQESSLDGWTLYDVVSNTTYGAWSDWSTTPIAGSDTRTVQVQYQYQDKAYTTATSTSLSGWTLVSSTPIKTDYSAWGGNQTTTTKPTASDTLQITKESSVTTYHYFHYVNSYTDEAGWGIDSVGSGGSIKQSCGKHTYDTNTALSKVDQDDIGNKQAYGSHKCTQGTCATEKPFYYWFLGSTTTTTTYTYQTRTKTCTYQFYRWGDWSSWGDTAYTASDTRHVNTRYRYQDRYITNTYYFKRTIYGDFSDWSDEKPQEQDGIEIKTREVYVY